MTGMRVIICLIFTTHSYLLSHPSSFSLPHHRIPRCEKKSLEGCRRYVYVIRFARAHPGRSQIAASPRPLLVLIPQCLVDKEMKRSWENHVQRIRSNRGIETATWWRFASVYAFMPRDVRERGQRMNGRIKKEAKSDGREESNGIRSA